MKYKNSFLYSVFISPDVQLWDTMFVLRFGVWVLLFSLFDMDSCVHLLLPPAGVFARYCRVECLM